MSEPENIEFRVSGAAKVRQITVTVHAPNHFEAVRKANAGEFIGELELDETQLYDFDFDYATPGTA